MKGHGQLMTLLNGWNKKIGKLMVGTRNGGFVADGRPGEKNSGPMNFCRVQKFCNLLKFRNLESFQAKNYSKPTAAPAKQKTKNCEETNL